MKKLLLCLSVIIIVSACETESSDDVIVSAIYQSYYCKYDADADKTYAYAEFRDGGAFGNDVILYAPSGIAMNGETMDYSSFPYILYYHYKTTPQDGEVMEGAFVFTDKNSKTYTNVANMNTLPAIGFPSGMDTISKLADLVMEWTGSPVGTDETIDVTITADTVLLTANTSQLGDVSITFSKSDLETLQNGNIDISLKREKNNDLQEATAKGGAMLLIYSTNKNCVLKD